MRHEAVTQVHTANLIKIRRSSGSKLGVRGPLGALEESFRGSENTLAIFDKAKNNRFT